MTFGSFMMGRCMYVIEAYRKDGPGRVVLLRINARFIYNILNSKEYIPISTDAWKTELSPCGVDNVSMKDVFKICFKTSKDSSVQWLQNRILHIILPTGYYLEKNAKTDDLCRFCTNNVETITHIFTSCTKTQTSRSEFSYTCI
jgi:hypothetical protein